MCWNNSHFLSFLFKCWYGSELEHNTGTPWHDNSTLFALRGTNTAFEGTSTNCTGEFKKKQFAIRTGHRWVPRVWKMPQFLSVKENLHQLLLRDRLLWVFVSGSLQGNVVRPYQLYFLVSAVNLPQLHHIITFIDIHDYLFVSIFLSIMEIVLTWRTIPINNRIRRVTNSTLTITNINLSKNLDNTSTWSVRLDFRMLVIYYPIVRLSLRQ